MSPVDGGNDKNHVRVTNWVPNSDGDRDAAGPDTSPPPPPAPSAPGTIPPQMLAALGGMVPGLTGGLPQGQTNGVGGGPRELSWQERQNLDRISQTRATVVAAAFSVMEEMESGVNFGNNSGAKKAPQASPEAGLYPDFTALAERIGGGGSSAA